MECVFYRRKGMAHICDKKRRVIEIGDREPKECVGCKDKEELKNDSDI